MTAMRPWKAVGDAAILIDFGGRIDPSISDELMAFDTAIAAEKIAGVVETIPSYAAILICFDPLQTDHQQVADALSAISPATTAANYSPTTHKVHVDYGGASGPDLDRLATETGLSPAEVIAYHIAGNYRVYMGGFAPGYAYLGGTPAPIQLPRKVKPETGHPPGSVIIAGGQCLITTLPMPTGWWVIGKARETVFMPEAADPFLLKPGDHVRFVDAAAQ
jgi:inhibitor of KinA